MRKLLQVILLSLVMLLANASQVAYSQSVEEEPPNVKFYLNVGGAIPVAPEDFSDFVNIGYNAGAGIGIPINEDWEVVLTGMYNRFGLDEDEFRAQAGVGTSVNIDGHASIISGEANIRYTIPSEGTVMPYLTAGFGAYREGTSDITVSDPDVSVTLGSESETNAGANFGFGLAFSLSDQINAFVEPRYTIVFSEIDNTHYVPVRVGIVFKN